MGRNLYMYSTDGEDTFVDHINMLTNNQSHPKFKYAQCCIFYLICTLMYNNKLQTRLHNPTD